MVSRNVSKFRHQSREVLSKIFSLTLVMREHLGGRSLSQCWTSRQCWAEQPHNPGNLLCSELSLLGLCMSHCKPSLRCFSCVCEMMFSSCIIEEFQMVWPHYFWNNMFLVWSKESLLMTLLFPVRHFVHWKISGRIKMRR